MRNVPAKRLLHSRSHTDGLAHVQPEQQWSQSDAAASHNFQLICLDTPVAGADERRLIAGVVLGDGGGVSRVHGGKDGMTGSPSDYDFFPMIDLGAGVVTSP